MAKKTKPFKFPDTAKDGLQDAVIFCPSERVLALYNRAHSNTVPKKSIAKSVKEWFVQEALNHGWLNATHLNAVQTKHSAGFILFNPGYSRIKNGHIVVLIQKD